jgi:CheY-like chemotaxis protein
MSGSGPLNARWEPKVWIVEDEPLVAMVLEDILFELGIGKVEIASSFEEADRRADRLDVEVAIMDINLHGKMSYPVAEKMVQRGIPVILVTGYAAQEPPGSLKSVQIVPKPYRSEQIAAALKNAIGVQAGA